VVKANPTHLASISQFYDDAAAGRLPAFALVDPDFGGLDVVGGLLPGQPLPQKLRAQGQDEENPQNIRFGEGFVSNVVQAVMGSPAWPRTLLVWLYDEHGGYYDHLPPPSAVLPDGIPPDLQPGDTPGNYGTYGVRVPAVVVSPWAKAGYVSPVVHDHTSILRFLETKWNLPALTYRDANASNLLDFLDFRRPAFADAPSLAAPADAIAADSSCTTDDPNRPVEPARG
jgi:phospholipase C